MTLVFHCDICERPFRSSDLNRIEIDPPHYEDLPEPTATNYVDVNIEGEVDRRMIRLRYCEYCLDDVELPPLDVCSDPDQGPKVHWPGTEHDEEERSA